MARSRARELRVRRWTGPSVSTPWRASWSRAYRLALVPGGMGHRSRGLANFSSRSDRGQGRGGLALHPSRGSRGRRGGVRVPLGRNPPLSISSTHPLPCFEGTRCHPRPAVGRLPPAHRRRALSTGDRRAIAQRDCSVRRTRWRGLRNRGASGAPRGSESSRRAPAPSAAAFQSYSGSSRVIRPSPPSG